MEDNNELTPLETSTIEQVQITKKDKIKLSLKLSGFIICSISYFLFKAFDRFGKITSSEIIFHQSVTYTKTIMYFTHFMSILVIIIGLFILVNKFHPIKLKLPKRGLKGINEVLDWLLILPICVVISTFLFTFIFTLTVVNGSSMMPTISNEDQLVLVYSKKVERFDVIVIDVSPEHYHWYNHKLFLKRVIGLPGEEVNYRIVDGKSQLYINNVLVHQSFYPDDIEAKYQDTFTKGSDFFWNEVCYYYDDEDKKTNCQINDGKIVIPEGYYFVLGDNRGVSQDSRALGLIKGTDILGRAAYKMHSIFKYERIT